MGKILNHFVKGSFKQVLTIYVLKQKLEKIVNPFTPRFSYMYKSGI